MWTVSSANYNAQKRELLEGKKAMFNHFVQTAISLHEQLRLLTDLVAEHYSNFLTVLKNFLSLNFLIYNIGLIYLS